jgi:hypothetical protein
MKLAWESVGVALRSRGLLLDHSPEALGQLTRSADQELSDAELRSQMDRDGYLYLPGLLPRDDVLEVRRDILDRMYAHDMLDPSRDPMEAVPNPDRDFALAKSQGSTSLDDVAAETQKLSALVFGKHSTRFFERLIGNTILHFDLKWLRTVAPGMGTVPHCDIVYMGRGTHQLYTLWVPYSDIPLSMGGLMLLESSRSDAVRAKLARYLRKDVDEYCSNRPLPAHVDLQSRADNKVWPGWLAKNPVSLRRNLGGRWLTSEYRMGDALVFPIDVVHGSLDNQSDSFRLSSDTRYQSNAEPVDERFVGKGPFGHTGAAKRGRLC